MTSPSRVLRRPLVLVLALGAMLGAAPARAAAPALRFYAALYGVPRPQAERRIREYAQNLTLRLGSIQAVAKQAAEHGLRPDDLDHIIRLADPPKPPADNEARTTP